MTTSRTGVADPTTTTEGALGTPAAEGAFFISEVHPMRIHGRILRASDLRERRVLIALGVDPILGLRVPRSHNPYAVARRIRRLASAPVTDFSELRSMLRRPRVPIVPTPDVDLPFPTDHGDGCPSHL